MFPFARGKIFGKFFVFEVEPGNILWSLRYSFIARGGGWNNTAARSWILIRENIITIVEVWESCWVSEWGWSFLNVILKCVWTISLLASSCRGSFVIVNKKFLEKMCCECCLAHLESEYTIFRKCPILFLEILPCSPTVELKLKIMISNNQFHWSKWIFRLA